MQNPLFNEIKLLLFIIFIVCLRGANSTDNNEVRNKKVSEKTGNFK